MQDESAIEPLLGAAAAEELPLERQSYAARLAAELTAKFNLDPQPVRKALWKLEHAARAPEIQLLLAQSLLILDEGPTPGARPHPPLERAAALRVPSRAQTPQHRGR